MYRKIAFLILVLNFQAANSAQILIDPDYGHLRFEGVIDHGTPNGFEVSINYIRDSGYAGPISILLDSPGGDVEAAFEAGRIIRKHEVIVGVPLHSKCYSSCVFLVAGGIDRLIFGEIGIHRPFFLSSPEDVDQSLKRVLLLSKKYLEEMNIPSSLADDMFSIAPSDIKVLKPNEISIYRLGGPDMVYSEKRELAMAKQLGLSRLEYMKRERQASKLEKECSENFPETDEWLECYQKARRDLGLTL